MHTLDRIQELADDEACAPLVLRFKSVEALRKVILRDFFRHGFNGDGDDGGSCIDGEKEGAWDVGVSQRASPVANSCVCFAGLKAV